APFATLPLSRIDSPPPPPLQRPRPATSANSTIPPQPMSLRSLTLLAALLAAEILWSQVPPLRGVWPHLTLVWFVFAAVWIPAGPLLGLAAAVGVLEDVIFGSAFGVHPLGLVVVAAAARRWRHHL